MDLQPKLTEHEFNLVFQGHAAFQLLWSAAQFDLFTLLAHNPGLTTNEVAQRLKIETQPARILLTGLASIKFLEKSGEGYKNARLVNDHLVKDNPDNMLDVLGWQYHITYKGLIDFHESLLNNTNSALDKLFPGPGDTLYQRLTKYPEIEMVFQKAMSSLSRQANKSLVEQLDLSNISHLVDVGGGNATNAITFAKKFPHLKLTVFDSPSVCEIAKNNIREANLQERIDTHAGDLFTTDFPDGVDAILFCHMFTIWSAEENQKILKKAHASLPDGGKLIIFNMMGNDDDTGPVSTALGSPYFLAIATGKGMLYSWKDYESWVSNAGFRQYERVEDLPLDHGFFIATK